MHGAGKDKRHGAVVMALIVVAIVLLHGAIAILVWHGIDGLSLGAPLAHVLIALLVLALVAKAGYLVARHFRKRRDSGATCPS